MKIVIAGGGKVGSVLCTELSTEEHDIILIEKNETILDSLINKNDISGIVGNGASYDIQQEAGVDTCDLFIAVTPQDELNMIACILAKKLGARYTIAPDNSPNPFAISETLILRASRFFPFPVVPPSAPSTTFPSQP